MIYNRKTSSRIWSQGCFVIIPQPVQLIRGLLARFSQSKFLRILQTLENSGEIPLRFATPNYKSRQSVFLGWEQCCVDNQQAMIEKNNVPKTVSEFNESFLESLNVDANENGCLRMELVWGHDNIFCGTHRLWLLITSNYTPWCSWLGRIDTRSLRKNNANSWRESYFFRNYIHCIRIIEKFENFDSIGQVSWQYSGVKLSGFVLAVKLHQEIFIVNLIMEIIWLRIMYIYECRCPRNTYTR